jgi:hypothetical protein
MSSTTPADHYYEEYNEYAKNVRIWFVAYGVGGPALILTQPSLYNSVQSSGHARGIALAFLIGVAIQILSALLYKAAAWHLHSTRELHRGQTRPWAAWVERWYWIDVAADLVTLALFVYSTVRVLGLLPRSIQVQAAAQLTSA